MPDHRLLQIRSDVAAACKEEADVRTLHFPKRDEILPGKSPYVYRVTFMIDGDTVRVFRIRRAQRRPLTRKQIDEASEQDKPQRDG